VQETHDIKNTPTGVVRMCCTGLLFSVQGKNTALKTPEVVVRMCCAGLPVSLPGSARNTYGIKNTTEGVA
jgi:hypothetical protein